MTCAEEFKQKLFALLREYDVEMYADEDISFWSDAKWDENGDAIEDWREPIDFTVGVREDGK